MGLEAMATTIYDNYLHFLTKGTAFAPSHICESVCLWALSTTAEPFNVLTQNWVEALTLIIRYLGLRMWDTFYSDSAFIQMKFVACQG